MVFIHGIDNYIYIHKVATSENLSNMSTHTFLLNLDLYLNGIFFQFEEYKMHFLFPEKIIPMAAVVATSGGDWEG